MSDITMCKGIGCKMKEACNRYTTTKGYRQSYFVKSPIIGDECLYYWNNSKCVECGEIYGIHKNNCKFKNYE